MANEIIATDLIKLSQSLTKKEKTVANAYFKNYPNYEKLFKWCCRFSIPEKESKDQAEIADQESIILNQFNKQLDKLNKFKEDTSKISIVRYYQHLINALKLKAIPEYFNEYKMINMLTEVKYLHKKKVKVYYLVK